MRMSALLDEALISESNMQHGLFFESTDFRNRTELDWGKRRVKNGADAGR